ncbi:hypothetical protein CHUAL_007228 [Chamberlinius hualienensis]
MEIDRKMLNALVLVAGQTLVQMNLAEIEAQSNLQLLAEAAAMMEPMKIQAQVGTKRWWTKNSSKVKANKKFTKLKSRQDFI